VVKDTAHDFVAFPRRKSTWTILGIGGAAALATHPADHYTEYVRGMVRLNAHVARVALWIAVALAVGVWVAAAKALWRQRNITPHISSSSRCRSTTSSSS
jgi:hypothetical protein